ncbi:MAG: hypothetical protein ACK4E8_02110 [Lacibacter sp.]
MTTLITVSSAGNGTLKTNAKTRGNLSGFLTAAALLLVSLAAMAFTTEDTTRRHIDGATADSCCTVTFTYGPNRITIANIRELNSSVLINGMDVQTYVNTAKAYSFKKIGSDGVIVADAVMDRQFSAAERENLRQAALLARKLQSETTQADAELNKHFEAFAAGPVYSNRLRTEAAATDMQLDAIFNDEITLQRQAVAFGRRIAPAADAQLDWHVRASLLQPIRPEVARGADWQMDSLVKKSLQLTPQLALEADRLLDAHIHQQ